MWTERWEGDMQLSSPSQNRTGDVAGNQPLALQHEDWRQATDTIALSRRNTMHLAAPDQLVLSPFFNLYKDPLQ